MDAACTDHHGEWKGRVSLKKRASLSFSIPQRLEGLSVLLLAIAALIFLFSSGRSLFVFPVADSYRWYGDETWMLLAWKNLLRHGVFGVPVAVGSTLQHSQGFLLGSPWIAAIVYGFPQLLAPFDTDIVVIGRTVSFIVGIGCVVVISWSARRLETNVGLIALAIVLMITTRTFTFATHSARYDILTGFALLTFVAVYTVRLFGAGHHKRISHFRLGLLAVITAIGISPHLAVLLPLVVLFIAWRARTFRKWKPTLLFVLGSIVAIVLLLAVYGLVNHDLSFWGQIRSDNQYGSVVMRMPILKLFSFSAQSHQLWAKRYYLWDEAPAFGIVLPLIVISEGALLLLRRKHPSTAFVTICFFLALGSALLFQSTLPYYITHLLPLATLTLVLQASEWRHTGWLRPAMAIVSLVVCAFIMTRWRPELVHAGRLGRRIEQANTAAVQAAFEEQSRNRIPGQDHPLVLVQAPALHELLRDTSIRLMSEAFLFFPERREPVDSTIARAHVDFILDFDHPMSAEYQRAVQHATPIFYRVGPLLDRSVDYFHDTTTELDTLTLYQMRPDSIPQE